MNKSNSLILFLGCIAIALSIVGCINAQRDLGHPAKSEVSIKWSQLKTGMNQDEVIALLGFPPHFEQKLDGSNLKWVYPFGTVTFEGASTSSMTGGTDGRLIRIRK